MASVTEDFDDNEEDTQKDKYLTFSLGDDYFGIDILYVTEIIGLQKITPVPELPEYIKGVINLRGKIIPVMDVRLRFRKEERSYDERTCVIVVDVGSISVGLIVDRVSEVIDIPEENISPPPKVGKSEQSRYVKGIGKINDDVKLILDCDKLLSDEEKNELESL